jgi:hypothetical protein
MLIIKAESMQGSGAAPSVPSGAGQQGTESVDGYPAASGVDVNPAQPLPPDSPDMIAKGVDEIPNLLEQIISNEPGHISYMATENPAVNAAIIPKVADDPVFIRESVEGTPNLQAAISTNPAYLSWYHNLIKSNQSALQGAG